MSVHLKAGKCSKLISKNNNMHLDFPGVIMAKIDAHTRDLKKFRYKCQESRKHF